MRINESGARIGVYGWVQEAVNLGFGSGDLALSLPAGARAGFSQVWPSTSHMLGPPDVSAKPIPHRFLL